LYSNAIKFTDRNGKILLHIEKEMVENKEMIIVSVSDSGIGVKE